MPASHRFSSAFPRERARARPSSTRSVSAPSAIWRHPVEPLGAARVSPTVWRFGLGAFGSRTGSRCSLVLPGLVAAGLLRVPAGSPDLTVPGAPLTPPGCRCEWAWPSGWAGRVVLTEVPPMDGWLSSCKKRRSMLIALVVFC